MTHQSNLFLYLDFVFAILFSPVILVIAWFHEIFCWLFIKSVKSISGEVAVVTGGGNGLGKEICIQLAKNGCHIAVVDINIEAAKETAESIQKNFDVRAKAYKVDVSNPEQVLRLPQHIADDLGVATILVNNAGVMLLSHWVNPHWREVQHMINVNLAAHFWTLDAFLPKMKELGKGHVVAISSLASVFALPYLGVYTASKAGVKGLMRVLHQELRALNFKDIHTTTVLPFFLDTNPLVVDLFQKQRYGSMYSAVSGEKAARRIVDGMLRNELQITIPSFLSLIHRLLQFFPVSWQEWAYFKHANLEPDFNSEEMKVNELEKNKRGLFGCILGAETVHAYV